MLLIIIERSNKRHIVCIETKDSRCVTILPKKFYFSKINKKDVSMPLFYVFFFLSFSFPFIFYHWIKYERTRFQTLLAFCNASPAFQCHREHVPFLCFLVGGASEFRWKCLKLKSCTFPPNDFKFQYFTECMHNISLSSMSLARFEKIKRRKEKSHFLFVENENYERKIFWWRLILHSHLCTYINRSVFSQFTW